MTDKILSAMEGALAVFEYNGNPKLADGTYLDKNCGVTLAITNLRAAIEQYKAQQSVVDMAPVAWTWQYFKNQSREGWGLANREPPFEGAEPLYSADQLAAVIRQRDELLEALKRVVESDGTAWVDLLKDCRAVIAKIEGEKG